MNSSARTEIGGRPSPTTSFSSMSMLVKSESSIGVTTSSSSPIQVLTVDSTDIGCALTPMAKPRSATASQMGSSNGLSNTGRGSVKTSSPAGAALVSETSAGFLTAPFTAPLSTKAKPKQLQHVLQGADNTVHQAEGLAIPIPHPHSTNNYAQPTTTTISTPTTPPVAISTLPQQQWDHPQRVANNDTRMKQEPLLRTTASTMQAQPQRPYPASSVAALQTTPLRLHAVHSNDILSRPPSTVSPARSSYVMSSTLGNGSTLGKEKDPMLQRSELVLKELLVEEQEVAFKRFMQRPASSIN